jgi:hypothetical protein
MAKTYCPERYITYRPTERAANPIIMATTDIETSITKSQAVLDHSPLFEGSYLCIAI